MISLDGGLSRDPTRQLALDLLNTDDGREDRLRSPDGLLDWLTTGTLADAETTWLRRSPPEARRLLDEARVLRSAVEEVVLALSEARAPSSLTLHALDRVLAAGTTRRRLHAGPDGWSVREHVLGSSALALLAPYASAAVELLSTAEPERLRRCASETCGLWFLDTSRNGRRRWCSMERCGNRAKARRHYRRAKGRRASDG